MKLQESPRGCPCKIDIRAKDVQNQIVEIFTRFTITRYGWSMFIDHLPNTFNWIEKLLRK